jgi:ribosomal protein L40E
VGDKALHIFHSWQYLDSEHRICSECGECQFLYRPPLWETENRLSDKLSPDHSRKHWQTCLASEMQSHIEERKKEILEEQKEAARVQELQKLEQVRKDKEKNAALDLLKAYKPKQEMRAPKQYMQFCSKCGAKADAKANFCRSCGEALH